MGINSLKEYFKLKKILILANDFYPSSKVAGFRPYGWFKYFNENGYYPIIVTTALNLEDCTSENEDEGGEGEILYAKYHEPLNRKLERKYNSLFFSLCRKFITIYVESTLFYFNNKYRSTIYYSAKDYLKTHKDVHLIIATGGPFILFKFAYLLSKEFSVPWVGDYRDTWTQSRQRNKFWYKKKINKHFELKYSNDAIFITTVSEYLKSLISKNVKRPIHVVPNGFNDWNFHELDSIEEKRNILEIALAGTIYPHHPIESFIKGLYELLVHENVTVKLDFYGINIKRELNNLITDKYPELLNNISFHKRMPNQELVGKLKKHHLLLVFNEHKIAGTKIFEYLAIRRNILLCFIHDEDAIELYRQKYIVLGVDNNDHSISIQKEIIDKTNSGFSIKNRKDLILKLKDLNETLKSNNGKMGFTNGDISMFSRREQTKWYAKLIDNANI